MKTLFERLSKENQEKIINFPQTQIKNVVIDALKKQYLMELLVKEMDYVCDILEIPFELERLRKLFNNN